MQLFSFQALFQQIVSYKFRRHSKRITYKFVMAFEGKSVQKSEDQAEGISFIYCYRLKEMWICFKIVYHT